jgi:rRNA maturation endonuclease Nob1
LKGFSFASLLNKKIEMDKTVFKTTKEVRNWIRANEAKIRTLYLEKDLTAKEVAEQMGVEYPDEFTKMLYALLGAKGKHWGGQRNGSGIKKGTKFCKQCGKKTGNCGDVACLVELELLTNNQKQSK